MSAPEVSALVITYNRARTIRQCIESILMQTYPSKEILVIDDGSTDDTVKVLQSYGDAIRCHALEHRGISQAWNAAISLSRGRLIAFLDSDDFYLYPDVFRDHVRRFEEDPGLDAVSAGWRIVDTDGKPLVDVAPWERAPEFDLQSFLMWKPAMLSAKMFRREILEKAGGFDSSFATGMDTDLILRILLAGGRIGWLRKITYAYRQWAGNMTSNSAAQVVSLRRVLNRAFSSPDLPGRIRAKEQEIRYSTELWLAWHLWYRGSPKNAPAVLAEARRYRREKPFYQLENWRRIFNEHSDRIGIGRISQSEFLSLAVQPFDLPDERKQQLAALLDWWWNVWSGYANKPAISDPRIVPPVNVVIALTKRCIQLGKDPAPLEAVERFWRDARKCGWVPAGDREDIITLYLACFSRSAAAHKFRLAGKSLTKALSASRDGRAFGPWMTFFLSAFGHHLLGRRPADEEPA